MIFLIISAVYSPEPVMSAQTSSQLAAWICHEGHSVSVITSFPSRPAGKLFRGYQKRLFQKKQFSQEYTVLRCFTFFSPSSSLISRTLENISFGFTSGAALLFSPRPDVIYSNTWPIFASGMVRAVAGLRRIPLVVSIQDLYPESLVSQGRIREGGWAYQLLLAIDRWVIRGCRSIIVISEDFHRNYRELRKAQTDQLQVVPNWVESGSVVPMEKAIYRKEKGIPPDAFLLVYGGNVGVAAGLETAIEALGNIRLNRCIYLVVAGSGSQMDTCRELAAKLENVHIIFHSPWEVVDTSKVLAGADVLLLPTRGKQSMVSVPSKLLNYMLAARPVLAVGLPESELARTILHANCGWVVSPNNPDALVDQIKLLANMDNDTLALMGARGREFALNNFVSEVCVPKVLNILQKAAQRNNKAGGEK